jgi:hypothetical protein
MVGAEEAREKALAACESDDVVLGSARELETGWYFPLVARTPVLTGVIVNKQFGRALVLYPDSSLDQDPTLYDHGYQWEAYDVVVLTVEDVDATARTLLVLRGLTVDAFYEDGRVRRIRREVTEDEIRARLTSLPAVFWGQLTYDVEEFEKARAAGWFTFRLLEHRPKG